MALEVFGKENCPDCVAAKSLLDSKGITYTYKSIVTADADSVRTITREQLLERIPNARTVPQFIFNGEVIGDFDTFKKFYPL
jgi:glutaredoxin 3